MNSASEGQHHDPWIGAGAADGGCRYAAPAAIEGTRLDSCSEIPNTTEPQIALGSAIRQLREAKGMSRHELAEGADLNLGFLIEIEAGEADIADWNTVAWVARAAGASLAEVATLAENFEEVDAKRQ